MLKKTITYEDLDGNTLIEDFYFHISKAELIELEVGESEEGFTETVKKIIAEEDKQKLIVLMKRIIMMSVGKRSEDGRRFIKSEEIRKEFEETNAYSELFIELATSDSSAAAFINGVLPSSLSKQIEEVTLPQGDTKHELPEPPPAHPTQKELGEMSREELIALASQGRDQVR